MNGHDSLRSCSRLITLAVVVALSLLPIGGAVAAPPPPTHPTDSITPPPEPIRPELGSHQPPVPGHLPIEAETARASEAMDGALSKYLNSLDSRYRAALTEVKVEGEWGYGIAEWSSDERLFNEPIYVLTRRLSDLSWQGLMPSTEGLFSMWLEEIPDQLLSTRAKSHVRTQGITLDALRRPPETPQLTSTPPPSATPRSTAYDARLSLFNHAHYLHEARFRYAPGIDDSEPSEWIQETAPQLGSCTLTVDSKIFGFGDGIQAISEASGVDWRVLLGLAEIEYRFLSPEDSKCPQDVGFGSSLLQLAYVAMDATIAYQGDGLDDLPTRAELLVLPNTNDYGNSASYGIAAATSKIATSLGNDVTTTESAFYETYSNYFGPPSSAPQYLVDTLASITDVTFKMPFIVNRYWTGGPHGGGTTSTCVSVDLYEASGIDFSGADVANNDFDTAVLAIADGTIVGLKSTDTSPGRWVAVRHDNNIVSMYWHLESINSSLRLNQTVSTGAYLGERGATGCSGCNPHIHLELRIGGSDYNTWSGIGDPVSWHTRIIDGWRIMGEFYPSGQVSTIANYNGSATREDQVSELTLKLISAGCPSNVSALVETGFPYNYETNWGNTRFAFVSWLTEFQSTNPPNCPGLVSAKTTTAPEGMCGGQGSNDTTPPSASSFTAQASGGTALLRTSGVEDNPGGSGVREVRFSAKWSGTWHGIGVDTTSPYSLDWDMCASDVPNGDVELGMEVWDNAGNSWIWSQHYGNPHITKDYNCAPPPPAEGVYLYRNTGQGGGSCYFTQDAPSIGNYCGSSWNDDAESVRVQGPYYFALYRDDNYSGGDPITGNFTGDLPSEWRNQASSIRIRRNSPAYFTLYDLGDYNGESFASDRTIHDLGHWRFNDRSESIRVASGYEVVVCKDAGFHNTCGRTNHDVSDMNAVAQGLRNEVSSVRVCAGSCPPAPNTPYLLSPLDGSVVPANESILFQWSGNGNQYLVEWWGGALGSGQNSGWRSGTQWSAGVLPVSNNLYYWRVKAWNEYGESDWSSAKSFYVKQPQPDLLAYAPPGYESPAVPSSVRGTSVSNTLYAGQPTFFDWHFTNSGTGDAIGNFFVELWVDSMRYARYPHTDFGRFQLGGFDDWQETVSTTGWHTVRLVVDPDNTIPESNETNNVWEGQYYWSPINGWWGEYYNNQTLSGFPVLVRDDSEVNFEWYGNSPDPSVPEDHFSARWTRTVYFSSGTYQFHVLRDDGARLWVDNNMILDAWQDGREEHYVDYTMDTGYHVLRMEMYENDGWARSGLLWQASNCNDTYEPNGSVGLATTVSYGQSVNAMICPAGDEDFYAFSGVVGDKVVVDIDAVTNASALDSYIYIVDSDGLTVLAENDDERPGLLDSKLGFELPHSGTYYVKVRAYGHPSVGGADHFYTMHLFTDAQAPTSTAITTPSNDAWIDPSWQNIVAAGSDSGSGINRIEFFWHDSNWANPDWVWLGADSNGNDGWSLTFQTASQAEQRGSAFYILAFDWVGNWAGAAVWNLGIDRTPPSPSVLTAPLYGNAPFRDFWVDWSASTDNLSGIDVSDVQYRDNGGVWTDLWNNTTLLVDRFVGEVEHSYDFRVRARDIAGNQSDYVVTAAPYTVQVCPVAPDSYEPDNTASSARWITVNGAAQSHNTNVEQDADWVKFSATAGTMYTLATSNPGGHADTQLWLYHTDASTLIASNDDFPGMGMSSRIDWQPSTSGVYYAKVDHFDPWAYGCTTQYGLSITMACNLVGDVNGDGVVNVLDVQAVAGHWGSASGSPNYDPQFDLDFDGDIDVADVMIVSAHWGSTC